MSDANEFNTVQLGSLFDKVHGGGTPPRNNPLFWKGEIPWASVKDFTDDKHVLEKTEEYISEQGLRNSTSKLIPENIPVICLRMAVGRSALTARPVSINQDLKALFPRKDIEPKYVVYLLQQFRDVIESKAIGSTVKGISTKDLLKTNVPFPDSIKEQQKIAKILTTVDNLIEKTEALIEKYQAIKQGMMHDLFTRGIDTNGQLRPTHSDAPHLYKKTKLGWIPKEWNIVAVDDVAAKVTDGDHHTPERSESGVYLLSARNVLDGELALDDVDFVPEYEYKRMIKRCHPEAGDILISCSGTIGRVCAVPKSFVCALVRSAALVKLNYEFVSTRFMEWVFRSSYLQTQVNAALLQAAQPNLFQGAIKKLSVKLVPMEEQVKISSCLDRLEDKEKSEKKYLQTLVQIKKGLMQDLLTGKIRVTTK